MKLNLSYEKSHSLSTVYQLKNLMKKIMRPCIIAGSCQHVLIDSFDVVKKVKNRLQGGAFMFN